MKYLLLILTVFYFQMIVSANDYLKPSLLYQPSEIHDASPSDIGTLKCVGTFSGPMKKYFYVLSYEIINKSKQDIKVTVRNPGISSNEILDLYTKKDELYHKKIQLLLKNQLTI